MVGVLEDEVLEALAQPWRWQACVAEAEAPLQRAHVQHEAEEKEGLDGEHSAAHGRADGADAAQDE